MKILLPNQIGDPEECPYIEGNVAQTEFFFAHDLNALEFDQYLSKGWRKFGLFFFKPSCPNCKACIPLRVDVNKFEPSKSQRRILKKNEDLRVEFTPLEYDPAIYEMYVAHSIERFNRKPSEIEDQQNFIETHFIASTPTKLSKFYLKEKLIAVGFLDISSSGSSSVYFIFDPKFSNRNLGTYGALKEIEYTKSKSLPYYYLGFYVNGNQSMEYKASFKPHQFFDWDKSEWS